MIPSFRMDTVYSVSLLVSLLAGILSTGLSAALRLPGLIGLLSAEPGVRARLRRGLMACVFVAYVALACSLAVHFIWGHQPGSAEALRFTEFFRIHPSFLVAAVLPAVAVALARRST